MSAYSWETCHEDVRAQVSRLIEGFVSLLGPNLVGIYLHGSLATGCFNPQCSDIDLLVIVRDSMPVSTKRVLASWLLTELVNPAPIELSVLTQDQLSPWQYPTPFEFHISSDWRERFLTVLAGDGWPLWVDETARDADLAAHITVTHARGVCLYGPAITAVFPVVPALDHLASILADVLDPHCGLGEDMPFPVYAILNACRTYAYLQSGAVLSKAEGGAWALTMLPSLHHALIRAALDAYANGTKDLAVPREMLASFSREMSTKIRTATRSFGMTI